MNRLTQRHIIPLIIAAALLFTLCSCANDTSSKSPDVTDTAAPSDSVTDSGQADGLFTVRYNAAYSFNPITGSNPDNMALVPLMYEGLFVLNEKMEAEPVLCESFSTSNGISYTFHIKPDIAMSDGSTLTATDVKYTLSWAMQTGRFTGHLKIIDSISVVNSLMLTITLTSANYKLPELLDIPVIKAGSIDFNIPPGSGPYTFVTTGEPRLVSQTHYRDYDNIPVSVIYLKECSDVQLSADFSSQAVDLFNDDPGDTSDIIIHSDHEARYYNTTILEFVGFNTWNSVISNPALRRAFGLAIDRKEISSTVYSDHALVAPLVLSPFYSLYDTAWETDIQDPLSEMSEIFASIGMADSNSDGYLEIPNSNNVMVPFTLKFIVYADNEYKVEAAKMIADSLKRVGINVNLTKLSWSAYMAALNAGSFDMYFGDVYLPADYDLTELLSPGGSLDYGHAGKSAYQTYIKRFLSASNDSDEKDAAEALCAYVEEYAPIIPVLYRQYAVHTNKNVISGMNPTQSNIFYGLMGWEITLG